MSESRTLTIGALCLSSILALGILADVGPALAQATPQGAPFTVNASATGDQDLPAVTATPDGGFAVVWRHREAGLEGVTARLLDSAGMPLGGDLVLQDPQGDTIRWLRTVARGESELVAAWFEDTFDLYPPEPIKIRRFDTDGTILGDLASPDNDAVGQPPVEHDLAAFGDGGLVLAWRQGPGDAGFTNEQVFTRHYDPAGEPGPTFEVNTSYSFYYGAQVNPSVAAGGEEFVVVWENQGFTGRGRAIAFRRYTTQGPLDQEQYLEPAFTAADLRSEPRVAADAGGNFVVTWTERKEPTSDLEVWAQRFARPEPAADPIAGEPFRVNTSTDGDQQAPDIAMDAAGNFIIVWRSDLDSGESLVEGRLFHRLALPVGGSFVVGSGASSDARPSVAVAATGQFLVAWHAPGIDGEGTSVAARRYDVVVPSCVEDPPRSLCLQQGRFRVEVAWRDFAGITGAGSTVPFRSDDSGLFWFFSPSNWEMLVKVLDGCGVNGFVWVFAAATTNVEYTLTVTDTETGDRREYFNPLGVSSAAITDTSAFAACSPVP